MIAHPIDRITVHNPISVHNLTVFPLFLSNPSGPEYIASSVALEQHGLEVTEISEGGSVPNLMVVNSSDFCVLLLDGEELRGAKQNRIINTTVLLAPRSKTVIPVSCTESGRWNYSSPTFSHGKTVMSAKARRRKTSSVTYQLAESQSYHSDQGEVWDEVAELHQKVGSHSPTSAMSDAFRKMRKDLDSAVEKIPLQEGQQGLIAMIDGKPVGMDLISQSGVYGELHPQLIQSYAMEALANKREAMRRQTDKEATAQEPPPCDDLMAKAFLERCAAIKGRDYPSVGMGTDWRFMEEPVVGSGLEVDDTWIHMAYFLDEPETDERPGGRRMARMSRRSHYRRRGQDPDNPPIF
jgi:hypothetical protein